MREKKQKVTVGGFLAVNGKVLVVRRSSKETYLPGYYELPGGKVNFGEHPEKSLEREFLEEVNLSIKASYLYRVFTYITNVCNRHTIELVYFVELHDNIKNIRLSDAHDDYRWISVNEIHSVNMTEEMKKNIEEGFKGI